jgi:hypothetical protein
LDPRLGVASVHEPEHLVAFALRALPSMQHPDGLFCFDVSAADRRHRGRSFRYTLIALLGLVSAQDAGIEHRMELERIAAAAASPDAAAQATAGDLGLVLWLASRRPLLDADAALHALDHMLGRRGVCQRLVGMERAPVPHRPPPARRRFAYFATDIYSILALATLARFGVREREARAAAVRVADILLRLQLPDGGWPWLFDVHRTAVVEPYEIYSVHQDAMAPMALLTLAEVVGEHRFADAAWAGLPWLSGANELAVNLFDPSRDMFYRSIRRRRPLRRSRLYANALRSLAARSVPPAARRLELNRTDRPYHPGWILEAWSGRGPRP